MRFHGPQGTYASRYTPGQMRSWAEKLVGWKHSAFVYFNNDAHGYAVGNALQLKREVAKLKR